MKTLQYTLFLILSLSCSFLNYSQDSLLTYNLKKGEAFDIILLSTKKESKETFREYRDKAFPIAEEMGYSFLPGFKILQTTQGNYQPEGLLFGKWKSISKRKQFLAEIDSLLPNFHQMRKKIWSLFNVTYYEVSKDISFELNLNKIIVCTAYWENKNDHISFESFVNTFKKALKSTKASIILELKDGQSPFGYYYNPDYLIITEWDNQEDFQAFLKLNKKMNTESLKNVNQFILGK